MPREVDPGTIQKGSGLANQNSVDSNSFTDEVIEGQNRGLEAHINDPEDAHPASAISTTGSNGAYNGDNVQENLDELAGLIPVRPPTIGNFSNALTFTGITDWGKGKLRDGGFVQRGEVTPPDPNNPTNDFFVYNEFWYPPYETQNIFATAIAPNPPGDVFTVPGEDPSTDPTFNVDNGGYPGGGTGATHHGGFTRTAPVVETARAANTTVGSNTVISGSVYPADRGVIALFHWPADGGITEFLAQPLTDRVVAAILCGQGVNDDCDGDPGGIFTEGDPNVFAFPGRASGQYDLVELHLGTDGQTGDVIPPGPEPGAGQVRLGTDPAAGVPVVPGGIPILGGTTAATGGGNDDNFFRYRLPYLDDYTSTTGIEFTPDVQKPRYFTKPPVSLDPGTDLTQAGDFVNFPKDYWTFQVSRYRHQFDAGAYLIPDNGSYILLHFKRERDFESFARDGIMPDDIGFGYEMWSANMVNYINPESVDNLVDSSVPAAPTTSTAYHLHRSAVFVDSNDPLISLGVGYTFASEVDETMFVSGIQYFLPNGTGVGTNWQIDTLTWGVTGLFAPTYLLGGVMPSTEETPGLWHRPNGILYLGMGTADFNIINGLGAGYTGTAFYQRVDFDYTDLDSVSGPFDLTVGPTTIDSADIVLLGGDTPITFGGDDNQCHFWFDARLRVFARKPQNQQDPITPNITFLFPNPTGDSLLMHTTSHSPSFDSGGDYGNFKVGVGDFPPRANLENPRKDVEERFYDEVYRVAGITLPAIDSTYNPGLLLGNLTGPGLPFGPAGPIELPVRFAGEPFATFGGASYLRADYYVEDLASSGLVPDELQVSGLPDRAPPATDGVENPCPFSGMVIYPQIDYLTGGFRPSLADGDLTTAQFDYSGAPALLNDRFYYRMFDAAYSNEPSGADREPTVVGQPFLTFRIDGLQLADFGYVAAGPGSPEIALELKIPGLTTWMDMGRRDMDGPSKQDPLVDGAGCQIIDPTATFDGRDAVTGTVFCQVRVNVGPAINIFANTGAVPGAPVGVAPVFFRARIRAGSGVSLNFTQGGPNATSDVPRALTGVTLLRHSTGLGPNDATPYGPPTPFP
jgi:hypothetical protein